MISQFSGIPFDLLPILLILVLHRKNFSAAQEEKAANTNATGDSSDTKILSIANMPRSHASSIGTNDHLPGGKSSGHWANSQGSHGGGVYSSRNHSIVEDEFNTEEISSHDLIPGGYDNFILAEI